MSPAIERAAICAVVVTYQPQPEVAANLAALAPQVGHVLIVDNGSAAQALAPVEEQALRSGATLIRLGSNEGIGAALNIGLDFARRNGFAWLATFDQDSRCTPGMIEEMTRVFESYPQPQKVAIITPYHVDRRLGFAIRERGTEAAGEGWRIIPTTMTSGNLLNVGIATAVGGFDDSLFIDYVDHEMCLRLRSHGYRILEASRARLLHSLGSIERRMLLFIRVTVTNQPVVRHYYRTRNRLIVWRQYWRREPVWAIRDIRRFLLETVCVLLYEQQARAKVPMIVRGLRDGWRNIRGALDQGR